MILYQGDSAKENLVNNNFYASSSANSTIKFGVVRGQGYKVKQHSLAELSKTWGYETTGKSGPPQWKNPQAFDYRLKEDSPALGYGFQVLPH